MERGRRELGVTDAVEGGAPRLDTVVAHRGMEEFRGSAAVRMVDVLPPRISDLGDAESPRTARSPV